MPARINIDSILRGSDQAAYERIIASPVDNKIKGAINRETALDQDQVICGARTLFFAGFSLSGVNFLRSSKIHPNPYLCRHKI